MSYIEDTFGFTGKTVVVTGGGGALAGAVSEALLKAGANISLWDIVEDALQDAFDRLDASTGAGNRIYTSVADTTDEASVRSAINGTEEKFDSLDVLINTAGGNRGKSSFIETDLEQFEFVLKLNLVAGLVAPTKVVAAHWIENGIKGSIINFASMASYIPLSGIWAYNAAKAGVLNLTMATAKELAPYGIRVNAVAPGFFIGKQNRALLIDEETGELTERGKDVVARTPFGRFGQTEELAGAILFLANNEASGFVTGISIPVDGGFLVDNI